MAKDNLLDVAKRIRIKAQWVTKNSDELVKTVALATIQNLAEDTPVRTGRARANWRVLFYKPSEVLFAYPDKPPHPGYGAERALEEAKDTIQFYTGRRSIWITNNVPYIRRLNEGSSAQAPAGFVEAAVSRAREIARGAKLLYSRVVL